jgi:uncharacterized protein (DUF302 family)
MSAYGFSTVLPGTIADVRPRVEAALKEQGFGVLTEIDIQATLLKKLGEVVSPYVILGACNPKLASMALGGDPMVGLLLPCNVVIRETGPGEVEVAMIDPIAMFQIVDRPDVAPVAEQAEAGLRRALAALG